MMSENEFVLDRESTFKAVEKAIVESYEELKNLSQKDLVSQRMDKYLAMGVFKG